MKKRIAAIVFIILSVFAVVQVSPLIWLVSVSFKTNGEIFGKSPLALPEGIHVQNYVSAWIDGNVAGYFFNSVIITASTVVLVLILSSMIAYAITRMKSRINHIVLPLIMAGMTIPIHAILIPLFLALQKMHLLGTYFAVILPYTTIGMPLGVFVFSNFMRSMPRELESAAFIDGCGVIRSFFSIILPTLRPAIATIAIFQFMSSWNEFIMAVTFLNNKNLYTLPVGLAAFKGTFMTDWGPLCAAMVISAIPLLIFYFIFSEQVEKSFSAGAVLK